MAIHTFTMPYPEDLPAAIGVTPDAFERALRFLVAAQLYELGRVTAGYAAPLAGIARVEFLEMLGQYHISVFNYDLEELEAEIQDAQARARRTP